MVPGRKFWMRMSDSLTRFLSISFPLFGPEVHRQAAFAGVVLDPIGTLPADPRGIGPALVTPTGRLHLYHVGPQPGEYEAAARARLISAQVQDSNPVQGSRSGVVFESVYEVLIQGAGIPFVVGWYLTEFRRPIILACSQVCVTHPCAPGSRQRPLLPAWAYFRRA